MKLRQPQITIAIPTWRRAAFLAQTLKQLRDELGRCSDPGCVEILVSDNCSPDNTEQVVLAELERGLPLIYVRNQENCGSDANIAQCFNLASGRYVLILGDDDLLMDGVLEKLIQLTLRQEFGVVCLRPCGFDRDFRAECPVGKAAERCYSDSGEFLARIGPLMTLISACLINKELMPNIDAMSFVGRNLVQVHLVLEAALAAKSNLFVKQYSVACKRNNSGGYDFSQVFVTSLGEILDEYRVRGLSEDTIDSIESRFLISYYPYYLFRLCLRQMDDRDATFRRFEHRFSGRPLFRWWIAPILVLPRPAALIWAAATTLIGRAISGDLKRGVWFLVTRISSSSRKF